jgi:hypothetical protein
VFALLLGLFSVLPCALDALGAQAHVYFVLCVGAVAGDFPEEAAGVALVEGGDDIGAVCGCDMLVEICQACCGIRDGLGGAIWCGCRDK